MARKQTIQKDKWIVLFGTVVIIVAVLQLFVGIFYFLSAFAAMKTGVGNLDFIYKLSYIYLIYGILDLIGGIGVLNLNNIARYLLIGMSGIKIIYILANSRILASLGFNGYEMYSIISLLYFLFVVFFLLRKEKYFVTNQN